MQEYRNLSTSNYNDAMSANNDSLKDLEISYTNKVHGDKVTLQVGQLVLITDQSAKHFFLARVRPLNIKNGHLKIEG